MPNGEAETVKKLLEREIAEHASGKQHKQFRLNGFETRGNRWHIFFYNFQRSGLPRKRNSEWRKSFPSSACLSWWMHDISSLESMEHDRQSKLSTNQFNTAEGMGKPQRILISTREYDIWPCMPEFLHQISVSFYGAWTFLVDQKLFVCWFNKTAWERVLQCFRESFCVKVRKLNIFYPCRGFRGNVNQELTKILKAFFENWDWISFELNLKSFLQVLKISKLFRESSYALKAFQYCLQLFPS